MRILNIVFGILVFLGLLACEDTLNPKLDNRYGDEWTWGLPGKAEGVLMNAYASIPVQFDYFGGNFLDVATDNAVTNDFSSGVYNLGLGGISATINPVGNWNSAYDQLRNINMFLEHGLSSEIVYYLPDENIDAAYRDRLKGEAYFLRAWWSMELLKVYGGVADDGEALGFPIITEPIDEINRDQINNLRRNLYEECVLQILDDCDTAIHYLPMSYGGTPEYVFGRGNIGRATAKTAYALKSRVALMGASEAYQPEGDFALSQDSVLSKWQRAALLSYDAIINGNLGGFYALDAKNLAGSALKITPDEYLFRKFDNNNSMENRHLPPAFLGNGFTNPSQNLVDAFPADNGFPIDDPRSGYDPQNPYVNRDHRFYLNIYTNEDAVEEGGRGLEIFYDVDNQRPGLDAPGYDFRNTRTGYYLRKWLAQTPDMLKEGEKKNAEHMHVLLRRAEVYYNWAEASNEALGPNGIVPGCDRSALDILRDIRKISIGVGDDIYLNEVAAAGKEALRTLIQNERRLEFAFENMRYFDMRRRMIPLDASILGARIEMRSGTLIYYGTNPEGERIEVETRPYNDEKYYYSPLPYEEIVKNPNLKNNKGW
jgi:hypothetical protein